jgi:hypothetical protein
MLYPNVMYMAGLRLTETTFSATDPDYHAKVTVVDLMPPFGLSNHKLLRVS